MGGSSRAHTDSTGSRLYSSQHRCAALPLWLRDVTPGYFGGAAVPASAAAYGSRAQRRPAAAAAVNARVPQTDDDSAGE